MAPIVVHEIASPVPDTTLAGPRPSRRWIGHLLWWLLLTVPVALALVAVAQPS